MDENSCENETTESVDDQKEKKTKEDPKIQDFGAKLALTGKPGKHQVSNRCGSSVDAAGPSDNFYPLKIRPNNSSTNSKAEPQQVAAPVEESAQTREEPSTPGQEGGTLTLSEIVCEPRVRVCPQAQTQETLQTKRGSVGPPPSYSFVMKQKKKLKRVPSPDPLIANRPPPPNYAGSRGLYMTSEERTCGFPSFAEPIWRSHSQPALCPRCGIIVVTTTHSHESIATHVAALALCLFGCWPCCLLPYCMNVCKNTYHYCPICQSFLGLYTPW